MATKYLDKTGLGHFWSKIKAWCNSLFALDSAVVHKTGDEIIEGTKRFKPNYVTVTDTDTGSSVVIKSSSYSRTGTSIKRYNWFGLYFEDKDNNSLVRDTYNYFPGRVGGLEHFCDTQGTATYIRLLCHKGSYLAGTADEASIIMIGFDSNGTKFARAPSTSENRSHNEDIITRDWIPKDTRIVHTTSNETIAGTKTFSSSPVAPTPTASDNSTKVATTAFVKAQGYLTSHQTLPTLSLTTSGSGNAITALSVSNHAITATKGSTFLTSSSTLDATKLSGTASVNTTGSAAKLTTARTISAGNLDFKGSASFDGSNNINLNILADSAVSSLADTNVFPYHRIAYTDVITGNANDISLMLLVTQPYYSGGYGICRITIRTWGSGNASTCTVEWLVRTSNLPIDRIQVGFVNTNGATYADVFHKVGAAYQTLHVRALGHSNSRYYSLGNKGFTLVTNGEANGSTLENPKTSNEVYTSIENAGTILHNAAYSEIIVGSDNGIVNTATIATKLETARTLWGQSFDGSANITGALSSVSGITFTDTVADSTVNVAYGKIAGTDYFRIIAGGASNAGYLELSTADDGNEPIYVRQYSGVFTTLKRTATILDESGNTSFPGTVTATGFTGNVTGNVSGSSGSCTGNANTATKLANARTISLSGAMTGSTSFNGSANSEISAVWRSCVLGQSSSSSTNPWYKVAACSMSELDDSTITFLVEGTYSQHGTGILKIHVRTNSASNVDLNATHLFWISCTNGIADILDRFVLVCPTTASPTVELWTKITDPYMHRRFTVLSEGSRVYVYTRWTLFNASTAGQAASITTSGTQIESVITSASTYCTGNAATATKLATARAINGTNFDGSTAITTSNWGTARNILISDSDGTNTGTAVSVNGSANATLKLPATIKASITGNCSGTSSNVTGTVAIANGGTGATTVVDARRALFGETMTTTNSTNFAIIGDSWNHCGWLSVANTKTLLGLKSAAYTESSAYATANHTHSNYLTSHQSLANYVTLNSTQDITGSKYFSAGLNRKHQAQDVTVQSTNDIWSIIGFIDKNNQGMLDFNMIQGDNTRVFWIRMYDMNKAQHWMFNVVLPADASSAGYINMPHTYPMSSANTLGSSSKRWGSVWAVNGAIQTSDERVKEDIDVIPDEVLDAWEQVEWLQFKMKDSVKTKGSNARLHSGVIAQRIKNAFNLLGVNPADYGFFCWDEWDTTPASYDEEGNIITNEIPAGEQYSIRYDEALAIEAAYQRRKNKILENRISELEKQLAKLEGIV